MNKAGGIQGRRRRRWPRRLAVTAVVTLGLYALVGFVVLPWALQRWAVPMASDFLNGELTVANIDLNPFALTATVEGLSIVDEAGTEVVAVARFFGNLQLSSLVREGFVLRRVDVDEPYVYAELREDGTLNLAALIKPSDEPTTEPITFPRLRGEGLSVRDGKVEFVDRLIEGSKPRDVSPISFHLDTFDTAAEFGNVHRFEATTEAAERITWEGKVFLDPLTATGDVEVVALDLSVYQPYVNQFVPMEIAGGELSATVSYEFAPAAQPRVAKVTVTEGAVDGLSTSLEGEPLLAGEVFGLQGVVADAVARSVTVAEAFAQGPQVQIMRDADGTLPVVRAVEALLAESTAPGSDDGTAGAGLPSAALNESSFATLPEPFGEVALETARLVEDATQAWSIKVESVRVEGGAVAWEDEAVTPAVRAGVSDAEVTLGPVDSTRGFVTTFGVAVTVGESGTFTGKGEAEPLAPRLSLSEMKAESIELMPFAPYVTQAAPMFALEQAVLGVEGDATATLSRGEGDTAPLPAIATQGLVVTGTFDASITDVEPAVDASLRGFVLTLTGLDTAARTPAQLDLKTAVNDGRLAVTGSVLPRLDDPLSSDVDLTIDIDELGLPVASGYAGRYVARTIASGELNSDDVIAVRLSGGQLDAKVPVRIRDFDFGEKVESDQAINLPVGLAVAILKGADGEIDPPALPISGDLTDPSVSIGGLVFHALTNLVTGIVASPFNMLAGAIGGDGESNAEADFSFVSFAPGSTQINGDAATKLDKLGDGLRQKPALGMKLVGSGSPHADDIFELRRLAFVDRLQRRSAESLPADDSRRADPSLISVNDAAYRQAVRLEHAASRAPVDGGITADPGAASATLPVLDPDAGDVVPRETMSRRQADSRRQIRGGRALRRTGRSTVNREPLFDFGGPNDDGDPRADTPEAPAAPDPQPRDDAPAESAPQPVAAAPDFRTLEREVLDTIALPDDAWSGLQHDRLLAVRDHFVEQAGLDAARLTVVPIDEEATVDTTAADAPPPTPRIRFEPAEFEPGA